MIDEDTMDRLRIAANTPQTENSKMLTTCVVQIDDLHSLLNGYELLEGRERLRRSRMKDHVTRKNAKYGM